MSTHFSDLALQSDIDAAAKASLAFLDRLAANGTAPQDVMRISAGQDVERWPGMLLPGTYNGIMCRDLLGGLADWTDERRKALADWLLTHRTETGLFRVPGMDATNTFKKPDRTETQTYIDFHVTNYALGALEALTPEASQIMDFVDPWLNPLMLKAWLADRDLRDPWLEGNNIVNIASFLLLKQKMDPTAAEAVKVAFDILFDWHDRLQDPSTGFWGVGQSLGGEPLLHAMAGSMHNFHLWYKLDRALAYQQRAVDYVLSRDPLWHSACIDVDQADLLVHAAQMSDYRREDIDSWLRILLIELLRNQNSDGGFADTHHSRWKEDGWVDGFVEAPGVSTSFATWFRWIAIAMIDDHLWPGRRPWKFRSMIGIGYRRTPHHD